MKKKYRLTYGIVITTYKRNYLCLSAVKSVLESRVDRVFVVNDDPEDDLLGPLLRSLKDTRVKYLKNDTNKGLAAARNVGAKHIDTDYIYFLDDDDELVPYNFDSLLAYNDDHNNDFIFTAYIKERPKINRHINHINRISKKWVFLQNYMGNTLLCRRIALVNIGLYNEKLRAKEDYDLNVRILLNSDSVSYFSRATRKVRQIHRFRMSCDEGKMTDAGKVFLESYRSLMTKDEIEYFSLRLSRKKIAAVIFAIKQAFQMEFKYLTNLIDRIKE